MGKAIDSWPASTWRSPKRKWLLTLYRQDGERDFRTVRGTYQDAKASAAEYLAGDVYVSCTMADKGDCF